MRSAALFHFDEVSEVDPSDQVGNSLDLMTPSTLTKPIRTDGILGGARLWAASQGFQAKESVSESLRLIRSMAIEAVVNIQGDGTRVLVQRGSLVGGGLDERILYSLKLTVASGVGTLQMAWQKSGGTNATVAGKDFTMPTGWIYVAASRRWISATSVEVRYWVNDRSIGSVTTTDGDIENGIGGTLLVGATHNGSGGVISGMVAGDIIDEVRISNTERADEEFLQQWRRCFVYPAFGRALIQQLLPPGDAYSKDPESVVQRELAIEGDGLSLNWSKGDEILDFFPPDTAYGGMLERWEAVTGISPKPTDGIQVRRNRILGHLRTVHGFSRDKIKDALADVLGSTPADLTVVENHNRYSDDFPGSTLNVHWQQTLHGGTATVASGNLTLAFASGDHRWNATQDLAVILRAAVEASTGTEIVAELNSTSGLTNTGDIAGVFFQDNLFVTGNVTIFGIQFTNPAYNFVMRRIISGVSTDTVYGVPPAGPWWLRLIENGGFFDLQYSTVGQYGPWTTVSAGSVTGHPFFYAGLALIGGQAAPGSAASAAFNTASVWVPGSREVFQWYIIRTGGTGIPDYDAGRQIIERVKPAHTRGWIVGTVFLCDDPGSLCDTAGDVLGM